MIKDFEQVAHTADIKLRIYGTTKEELFAHAVMGMFQVLGPHAPGCNKVNDRLVCDELPYAHVIEVRSLDIESLLVDFLSEILCLSDSNNEAYLAADIHEVSDTHIKATVHGVKINGFDVVEIKAVTYHDLYVKQTADGWHAEIVFDI